MRSFFGSDLMTQTQLSSVLKPKICTHTHTHTLWEICLRRSDSRRLWLLSSSSACQGAVSEDVSNTALRMWSNFFFFSSQTAGEWQNTECDSGSVPLMASTQVRSDRPVHAAAIKSTCDLLFGRKMNLFTSVKFVLSTFRGSVPRCSLQVWMFH